MQLEVNLVEEFFSEKLLSSGNRIASAPYNPKIRLNRNEAAFELDSDIKELVLKDVGSAEWKNYPPPYYGEIEELIANYSGVSADMVVPSAGSASIITTLLNYSAINSHQIVIARPSFSLYEFHCNTYGIAYETWWLNNELEYAVELMPKLKPNSLVLFASPNNPVGNSISLNDLNTLLTMNPQTFFLVDEVYSEFSDISLTSLIEQFPNLMLLRSFSKSFSAAGLRIGYLIAHPEVSNQVRKLILPFSLNYLSMVFAKTVLGNADIIRRNRENIKATIKEKQRVEKQLMALNTSEKLFRIKSSKGNFILIIFNTVEIFNAFQRVLKDEGVELLDLSKAPKLERALRFTVGKSEENDEVLNLFSRVKKML